MHTLFHIITVQIPTKLLPISINALRSFLCPFLWSLTIWVLVWMFLYFPFFLAALTLAIIAVSVAQDSPEVAGYARNYAKRHARDRTRFINSDGPYGENLAWTFPNLTGTEAANMWVEEKPDYNYNSNSCEPGKVCGHYTQVVWCNSLRLGCAKAQCTTGGTLITCNYDLLGNYVGEKPYWTKICCMLDDEQSCQNNAPLWWEKEV